jgi:hypothetical protein
LVADANPFFVSFKILVRFLFHLGEGEGGEGGGERERERERERKEPKLV